MSIDASVRTRWIQAGVVVGAIVVAFALILPAIEQSRESARRSQSKNNLKQIGLALQTYQEVHSKLPYGGIFDEMGTPFHGWTTALNLLLSQRASYDTPDPKFPWDDPVNIDRFFHQYVGVFQNPSIAELQSPDGLPLVHYAANQRLLYRNSVVSLDDVPEKDATALIGDANGNFVPVGYPFNWRDLSLGIGTSPDGFGCPRRNGTMFLMADQAVRWFDNRVDANVVQSLAGPGSPEPSPDQVAKPSEPYRLTVRDYWRYLNIVRAHKGRMTFRLAPDRRFLEVDFRRYDDPRDAVPEQWQSYFQQFSKAAPVEHIEVHGNLRANELLPLLDLPTLKRLTIRNAKIADDKESVLASARRDIVVD
jgi:type II secretory pathway pseudopilin PulG